MKIDICVVTYKRPELLNQALRSLMAIKLPPSAKVSYIIVDNDLNGSARPIVEEFVNNSDAQMVYAIEPEQNIALARNRAISLATGEYFAFIDDDECASTLWLEAMLSTLISFDADVVFGPVVPRYPDEIPTWKRNARSSQFPRYKTGTINPHIGTGNVLIKKQSLDIGHRFNPEFGLTGGSDTELFLRLAKDDRKIVWCDEAVLYETVYGERLTIWWMLKRAYRSGQTFARTFLPQMNKREQALWLVKRLAILGLAPLIPIICLVNKSLGFQSALRIVATMGQLTANRRYLYREYLTRI